MGAGGQRHAPAALPSGKTRYPLYTRPGGHHGRFGRGRKISPPPGFDARIVHPIVSRYTDYAIPLFAVHFMIRIRAIAMVSENTWRSVTAI
jgi:hypothetical protein